MRKIIIMSLIVLALLLTACNAAVQQQNNGNGQQSGNDDSKGFSDLIGKKTALSYKVTYDISSTGQATREMGMYFKGTKIRYDTTYNNIESRIYFMDSKTYTCNKNNAQWTCLSISAYQDPTPSNINDVEKNMEGYNVVYKGTKTIAGTVAKCYDITAKTTQVSTTVEDCFSNEGVPLYMKSESTVNGQNSFYEMSAKSYSTAVSDADFTLPATPTELNACSYCDSITESNAKAQCLASCGGQ